MFHSWDFLESSALPEPVAEKIPSHPIPFPLLQQALLFLYSKPHPHESAFSSTLSHAYSHLRSVTKAHPGASSPFP